MANDAQPDVSPFYAQDLLPHRFLNSSETIISDALLGLLNTNANIGILNYGKVVICRNYTEQDIVKIVSGGSSGHEPIHSAFVGKGMLTAAVQGDVFRTPYISEITNTIKEVSYKLISGVLVIIQNSTANRLSFGLAVERARSQGIDVMLLLVTDEFCIVNEHQGRRGLSGIVLINKIAGALAEREFTLENICKYCMVVNENISTILFSLKSSSDQGCCCMNNMKEYEIEIGTGLHGEEGIFRIEKTNVENTCNFMLNQLVRNLQLQESESIVVMINNLGNALKIEELTVAKEVVSFLHQLKINIARIYCGKFLTSLGMRGFTITILKVFDNQVVNYLDDYCEAFGWGGFINQKPITLDLQKPIVCRVSKRKRVTTAGPCLSNEQGNVVFYVIQFVCDALLTCERQLNIIDSDGGSGNIGTKIKLGAQTILNEMQRKTIDFLHPFHLFEILSDISEKKISGSIGIFYGIFFEVASNYFRCLPESAIVNLDTWMKVLRSANEAIKCYGNTEFGLGTMYDPLHACAETLEHMLKSADSPLKAFKIAVAAAEDSVLRSKTQFRKQIDPGAQVVGIWMRAVYEGLQLRFE